MTPAQIALNAKAIRSGAERLEAAGYTGDAHRFIESLLLDAFAAGFRPIEKPVPAKPERVASDEVRRAAVLAARAAVDQARRNRTGKGQG